MTLSLAWGIDDTVEVNGTDYPLNLEFSRVLRWYEVWKDDEMSEDYKMVTSLILVLDIDWERYPTTPEELCKQIPKDDVLPLIQAIIQRIVGDQDLGNTVTHDLQGNVLEDEEKRCYDIEEDSGYIYSSFLMDYGMDLIDEREKGSLHWDKFNQLLSGLSEETKFKRVIKIRTMEYPEKASQAEIDDIRKAKMAVALSTDRAEIEFEMLDLKQKREYMEKRERGEAGE